MRRFWCVLAISALAAAVACDQSLGPATKGSITVQVVVPSAAAPVSAISAPRAPSPNVSDRPDKRTVDDPGPHTRASAVATQNVAPAASATTLDAIRVSVSGGPTSKTATFQCSATRCEGTVDQLDAGTYAVTVEGLVSAQVAYYGKTSGVGVTPGANTTATVGFQNFQPTLSAFSPDTTTALTFTVSYAAVTGADSYIIEWSKASDFSSGTSTTTANGTSTTITVADVGVYYVRVRAVNATVTSGGRPSNPLTIEVTTDQVPSGDNAGGAPLLSSQWNYSGTITKVNVFPATDADWFKLQACTNDTLVIETFAARLTPSSGLNTLLQLRNASGAVIASNDDAAGTTDSKIQQVIASDGVYDVEVSSAAGTQGQYELQVSVRAGPKNATSKCTTTKLVQVIAPQDTLVALGDSMQLTATALDTTGTPVPGATFVWGSSNSAVLSVSQSGWVKAVSNGPATITATESGIQGQAPIAVAQAVDSVSVSPATATIAAGQTQQFAATAYDALNNTISGKKFIWVSNDNAVAVVDTTGLATGIAGGAAIITAYAGVPGNARLTVGAQVATHLFVSAQPTNSTAGDAISPAIQVEVRDASNKVVTASRDAVTVAIGSNPGSGTLSGTKTVNAVNGIASFSGLWINKAATGYTLSASATGLTGTTSTGFNISPAAPAKLGFSLQPTNAEGNVTMSQVQVTIRDQFDNVADTATSPVTMSLANNPWKTGFSNGSTLSGTLTEAAVAGVATFNDLRVDKPAPGYALGAASGALSVATSSAFNVVMTVQDVAAGGTHTCALATGGPYCWGYNANGQLGVPLTTTVRDSVAALVQGGFTFTKISAGANHSCGITSSGDAYCWGYNGSGQLGNNSTTRSDVPVLVSGGYQFADIEAGNSHTCAITTPNAGDYTLNRRVLCWGYNYYNTLGDNEAFPGTDQWVPTRVDTLSGLTEAASISAGGLHTCARAATGGASSGAAYCWGYDAYGQVGDGVLAYTINSRNVPTLVLGGITDWTRVSAGQYHTCALRSTGEALCWGLAGDGEVGNGTYGDGNGIDSLPQTVYGSNGGSPLNFTGISAGQYHSCGVTSAGVAYCWGYNGSGQLGDNNLGISANQPSAVSGGLTFVSTSITLGGTHSCARTSSAVYCWGDNGNGKLGIGRTGGSYAVPTQIKQ